MRKILIVDDQQINRKILNNLLCNEYEIIEAENGISALNILNKNANSISAILLDLIMPIMDGFDFLEQFVTMPYFDSIPIIVASQADKNENEQKALELGASDFIVKPYNPTVLKKRLSNLINLYESNVRISSMRHETLTDSLTGVANRVAMQSHIENFFATSTINDCVFFMIDIDNFKTINDVYGHATGDYVIKTIAQKLSNIFRDNDCVCRMGGDEFSVFMEAKLTESQLINRLEKMNYTLQFDIEKTHISCSIGACTCPKYGTDYQTIYHHADIALLTAKRMGKNRYEIYNGDSNMPQHIVHRNLDWLLDESSDAIVVCDCDNYSIYYLNEVARKMCKKDRHTCLSLPCYKAIWNNSKPCSYCIHKDKLGQEFTEHIVHPENTNESYSVKQKLIDWGNQETRIQYIKKLPENKSAIGITHENSDLAITMFEYLYSTTDIKKSINNVLKVIGKRYDVSRVYIFEDSKDHKLCTNTFEWCCDGITPKIDNLVDVPYDSLGKNYKGQFNDEGVFCCSNIADLPKEQFDILEPQGVKAMLQCALIDNNEFNGYIGFDECRNYREWTSEHIKTLLFVTKIIGTFLKKMRQEEEITKTNVELQKIINTVPGGIGIFTFEHNSLCLKYVNDGFYNLLHTKREDRKQFYGENCVYSLHPDDQGRINGIIAETAKTERLVDISFRMLTGEKNYIWVRLVGQTDYLPTGEKAIYCSFYDIDERMNLIEQLNRKNKLIETSMAFAKLSYWEYNVETNIVTLSPFAQDMLKLPEILPDPVNTLTESGYLNIYSYNDYSELFSHKFTSAEKNETYQKDIYFNINPNEHVCMRHIIKPVFDSKNWHTITLGVCLDVTELKKAQRSYENQIRDFQKIDEPNLIVKITYNLSTNIPEYVMLNPAYNNKESNILKCLGYDEALLDITKYCVNDSDKEWFSHTLSRDNLEKEYKKGNTTFSIEYKRKNNKTTYVYVRSVCKTFLKPDTNELMCFISNYNITDEKTTAEMMHKVVNQEYDYLALVDYNTGHFDMVQNVNKSNTHTLKNNDFLSETSFYAQKYLSKKQAKKYLENLSFKNIKNQLTHNDHYEFFYDKHFNNSILRKKLNISYIDKDAKKVLITCVDITSIYEEEQKQKNALMIANQAKSTFLSTISHDMRTPLNGILGMTNLMLDREQSEQNRNDLIQLENSGKYLLSLINDTLDISKIESGNFELRPDVYDGKSIFDDTIALAMPTVEQQNIKLDFHISKLPFCQVYVDVGRIQQVIMNIIGNAVKFSRPNSTIDIYMENISNQNGVIVDKMTIEDHGIGMSKEFLPHIFEPFKQEHTGTKTEYRGTGLGMGICKRIVELWGGKIWVESEVGKGTKVSFTLVMPIATQQQISNIKKINTSSFNNDFDLNNKTILLCEDHPLNATITTRILTKYGCHVIHAENGKVGCDYFEKSDIGNFDAILMDIRMPIMDGLEATKYIRSLSRSDAKTIPIIAMSANAFDDDVRTSLNAGMNEHLSKPIEPKKLLSCLSSEIKKMRFNDEK